jgi:hypothetical protein
LEKARQLLERAVSSVDIKDLRDLSSARQELRGQVDEILNKFSF